MRHLPLRSMSTATASRRALRARILGLLALAAPTLLLAGCEGRGVAEYPKRVPTPGVATLPEKPDLNPKRAPAQYPDGAWSVRGILESGTAGRKGTTAQVRGYVAKVWDCDEGTKRCQPAPHTLLTDQKSLQGRRLLVAGTPPAEAAEGHRITVEGEMMTSSPDGLYFAPGGLLLLKPPAPAEGDAAAEGKTKGSAKHAPKE